MGLIAIRACMEIKKRPAGNIETRSIHRVAFLIRFRKNRFELTWTTYLKSAYKKGPKSTVRCIFDEMKLKNIGHLNRWLPVIFCRPFSDFVLEASSTLMPSAYLNFHWYFIFSSLLSDFCDLSLFMLTFLLAPLASLLAPIAHIFTLEVTLFVVSYLW